MTWRYVGRRFVQIVPTVVFILLVGFLLVHLSPGDPVLALAGQHGDAAYYDFMREKFGLDESLPDQLIAYASNVLRGDLGISFIQGRPVADVIGERLGATLLLTATALVLSTVLGVLLGVVAAFRPGGVRDMIVTGGALGLYATPVFWIAQMAILGLALGAGIVPVQGMTSPGGPPAGVARLVDVARHLALPALILAAHEMAAIARLTRAALIEELASDHIRTARAKGLSEPQVIGKHALRRAMLPVTTVVGNRVGHLLAGAIVVEVIFGWPGMGRLLLNAVQTGDSPVLLGIFLLVAFGVALANLITDLAYGWLDPRVALT